MIHQLLLLDIPPVGAGGLGIAVGIGFFLVLAAVAFVAWKMLKRTVKMAVRMTIVVAIMLVALIGSIALLAYSYGGSGGGDKRPGPARTTPK